MVADEHECDRRIGSKGERGQRKPRGHPTKVGTEYDRVAYVLLYLRRRLDAGSGRVATYSPLGLPLELPLRLCVPASPRALCVLAQPGANLLASGMLFSGRRVSGLRCERQLAYVLRRLRGSERSTDLARSTQTAASPPLSRRAFKEALEVSVGRTESTKAPDSRSSRRRHD